MEFRQIEAFCAIVEWGSFSEAAKHLYISQPTVSSHLQKLEARLGKALLIRTPKSLHVTEEGRYFYQHAKQLLLLRNKTLLSVQDDKKRHLHIGASSIPSACILPSLLASFYEQHPDVTYHITQSGSAQILNLLLHNSLDISFTGSPIYHELFICEAIAEDEVVLVAPATTAYLSTGLTQDPLRLLSSAPFLIREAGSGTKHETESILETLGLGYDDLMVVAEMNDLEALKQSIIFGLGISLLPRTVVENEAAAGSLQIFPVSADGFYRRYYMIYPKSRHEDPVLSSLINHVHQHMQALPQNK